MTLREQFEYDMKDWIEAYGRPTFDEESMIYVEKEWQLAWVAYRRAKKVK